MRQFLGSSSRKVAKHTSKNYGVVIAMLFMLPSLCNVAEAVSSPIYPHIATDSLSLLNTLNSDNVSRVSEHLNAQESNVRTGLVSLNAGGVNKSFPAKNKANYSAPLIALNNAASNNAASNIASYNNASSHSIGGGNLEQVKTVDDIDAIADTDEIDSIDSGDHNSLGDDDYNINSEANATRVAVNDGSANIDDGSYDDTLEQPFDSTQNQKYEHSHVVNDGKASLDLTSQHVPLNAISPKTIQTFVEVIDTIRHDYVMPVNDEALFQYAISGMLEKLDKHAEYLTPEKYDNLRGFTDGEIGKVGLSARYDFVKQQWIIDNVVPDSSASQYGIKVGDKLLSIKKIELTSDLKPQDIEQLLSGIAGSQVEVQVEDKLGFKRNVNLQRNLSTNTKLEVIMHKGIAVVRLPVFQNSTKNQLIDAIRRTGEPVSGVILDVRNNPGGVLSAAIDVASLFIKDKDLIQVKNRTNSNQIIKPNGVPYLLGIPVVVLVNRYSASASEVLASSLKNDANAIIMGEKTFGKGTVQEVIPLKVGGAIKLTVAEYRSAKGDKIDGVGIEPDINLAKEDGDWQHQAIMLLLSKDLPEGVILNDDKIGLPPTDDY